MLGSQLLTRPGLVAGLMSLIRPQHLSMLAAWQASKSGAGPCVPKLTALPVLVANVLHDAILHGQPQALRNVYQVQTHQYHAILQSHDVLMLNDYRSL